VNKFDALKMFQGWPPEWQRLCAEYWIETGELEPTKVSTFGERLSAPAAVSNVAQVWCYADQVALAKKLLEPVATLANESVSARLAQDKAAKVAAVTNKKTHIVNSRESTGFTLDELQYAQKGIEVGIKDCLLAEDMAGRFGRTKKAFQNYISLIHRNGIDLSTGRKKPHGVQY
jgi:hypothetical protein